MMRRLLDLLFRRPYTAIRAIRDLNRKYVILVVDKYVADSLTQNLTPDVQFARIDSWQNTSTVQILVRSKDVLESVYPDYINRVTIGIEELQNESKL